MLLGQIKRRVLLELPLIKSTHQGPRGKARIVADDILSNNEVEIEDVEVEDSFNKSLDVEDSFNTDIEDSFNTDVETEVEVEVEDSFNTVASNNEVEISAFPQSQSS